MCTEVTSGSLAGRRFLFNYTTIDGTAVGMYACLGHLVHHFPRMHNLPSTTAPDDYTETTGDFVITDSTTVQCVDIPIVSDDDDELDHECFTFSLSTSDLHSLTVNIPLATICISDDDGMGGIMQTYKSLSLICF